jgi:hypothetical protein
LPEQKPVIPDHIVKIENKNILSDWRDIVRNGSDSNGTLETSLTMYSIKKAKDDQNRIIQIHKISLVFVILFSCFLQNFLMDFLAPEKGGGLFFSDKEKSNDENKCDSPPKVLIKQNFWKYY